MATGSGDAWKKKAAAFLAGLSSSQLFILTISSGNFSVGRFMLPKTLVGIYINRIVMAYRITAFIGTLIFTIWVKCDKNYRNNIFWLSSLSICLYCLSYILMFLAYYYGGEKGHIMYYYCGIIFSAFVYGSDNILLTNVAVGEIDYYVGSSQLISVLISIYQTSFIYFATKLRVTRIEFKLIIGQMIFAILLSALSAILWAVAYGSENNTSDSSGGDNSSGMNGFSKAASPIFMTAMGFGLQCLVYPAIAPYKIIGMDKGYKIGLAVLFTSAIPPLTHLFLSIKGMGAKKPWNNGGWHFAWLFILVQVILLFPFFLSLHYHDWPMSRIMRNNIWVMGAMTVVFGICVQTAWAVGMNGAPMQDDKGRNTTMDSVNTFTYTAAQLIFVFLGDGYLSTYRVYEKDIDNWPTKHYGTLRAFWFWTWSAIKYACKKAIHAYTSDLRGVILGKKDYLFIVYTDG